MSFLLFGIKDPDSRSPNHICSIRTPNAEIATGENLPFSNVLICYVCVFGGVKIEKNVK